MTELLYSLDKALFVFINQTLSNPIGDFLWPLITDYDKLLPVRIALVLIWLWLLVKGGTRGRTAALVILPVILFADQLSSSFIKPLVSRLRPCQEINGISVVQGIHLLVDCGPGKSFPSSHAVNNFAVATVLSYYYRRLRWAFLTVASLVALSRPAVGVHYPSDILAGALIGTCVAAATIWLWTAIQGKYFPRLGVTPDRGERRQ